MLITIITVCFNAEKSIKRTIKSVLHQTYDQIEYIIVDGKSNDNTLKIVNSFDTNIKIISEKDNGIYDAMNKGITEAEGDYITFLNADDYYIDDDFIKKITLEIKKTGGVDIYCTDIFYGNDSKSIRISPSLEGMKINMSLNHPGSFVKKNILKRNKFNTKFKIASDYELFLRLLSNKSTLRIYPIAGCFMEEGGASSKFLATTKEVFKIQSLYYGYSWACLISIRRFLSFFLKKYF